MKTQTIDWKKTFIKHITDKGLVPEIPYYLSNKKSKVWLKNFKRCFVKEDMSDLKIHKKGSVSLAIWEMQLKPTMKYYHTPTQMIKM